MQRSWPLNGTRCAAAMMVMAAALALGCATDQPEQNYRELESQPQRLQPEDEDPMFGEEAGRVESADADDPAEPAESAEPVTDTPEVADTTDAADVPEAAEPASADQPDMPPIATLQGDDRAHWDTTVVHPVTGQVTHGPVYFTVTEEPDLTEQIVAGPMEQRYRAAAGLDEAGTLSGDNLARAVIDPLRFYADVLLLPVRLIVAPPFITEHTSP
ncbi:MAG: hypothetical protein ACODAQ_02450 [Phycisphaeraceae bacterium]